MNRKLVLVGASESVLTLLPQDIPLDRFHGFNQHFPGSPKAATTQRLRPTSHICSLLMIPNFVTSKA